MKSFLQSRRLRKHIQEEVRAARSVRSDSLPPPNPHLNRRPSDENRHSRRELIHAPRSGTAEDEDRDGIVSQSAFQQDSQIDLIHHSPLPSPSTTNPSTPSTQRNEPLSLSSILVRRISGIEETSTSPSSEKQTNFLIASSSSTDRCNPREWPLSRRIVTTLLIFVNVLVCGWASAATSVSKVPAAQAFGVSKEVESLATALFLFGNGIGALASGPISETIGRNLLYFISMGSYLICVLITALAPNAAVQFIFRFGAGLMASPVLTVYGGSLADLWDDGERTLVWPLFGLSPILGPVLAPVVSGWFVQSSTLSWRWVEWFTLIISGFSFLLAVLFLPETFQPILLQRKASTLRTETGDQRFQSSHELQDPFLKRLATNLTRPLVFFTSEPIVIFFGLYLSILYVLVFTFLDGFTSIFVDIYHFTPGERGSAFAAIAVGVLLNTATVPFFSKHYLNCVEEIQLRDGSDATIKPEIRLWPAIFAAPLLPISLFWMGWTADASISAWSPLASAVLFGFALMGIFIASYQYIIDGYETYSASALSSITFARYMLSGGMVIADMPMYKTLGVHWTLTLLGCLGVALVPVPMVFWKFGSKIRSKSQFAKAC